jgi:hypothetical protein
MFSFVKKKKKKPSRSWYGYQPKAGEKKSKKKTIKQSINQLKATPLSSGIRSSPPWPASATTAAQSVSSGPAKGTVTMASAVRGTAPCIAPSLLLLLNSSK